MPWKESRHVNERMNFVTRLESGERMTDLCREFGISRKTGYKFWDRYQKKGPIGLFDESRRPITSPFETRKSVRELLLSTKRDKPTWGAGKIREYLLRKYPDLKLPLRGSVHCLFERHGLTEKRKRRRRFQNQGTNIPKALHPNDIWCADFKGEFRLGNSQYCYPLTITDHLSRYLIQCEGLDGTKTMPAKAAFRAAFEEYGLPSAILTDNGPPFGSVGLFGYSQLSVWWLRLGIKILRIRPGHPEENGRHERMHLTLKKETTRPSASNLLQQQEKFDRFREEFNHERPHEALGMKPPADLYTPSAVKLPKELQELNYPLHDYTRPVLAHGAALAPRGAKTKLIHVGAAFVGENVGLREEDDGLWKVTFMERDLGFFDPVQGTFSTLDQTSTTED